MIKDMALSRECVEIVLQKLKDSVNKKDVLSASCSKCYGIVSLLLKDGSVGLLNIPGGFILMNVLEDIQSVIWKSVDPTDDVLLSPQLCCLTKDGSVSVFELTYQLCQTYHGKEGSAITQVLECTVSCTQSKLRSLIADHDIELSALCNISLLQFTGSSVMMSINDRHVARLSMSQTHPPTIDSVITLKEESRQIVTVDHLLFTMDLSGVISIYNTSSGKCQGLIDTMAFCQHYDSTISNIDCFDITKDLKSVVLQCGSTIHMVDIDKYFDKFPLHKLSSKTAQMHNQLRVVVKTSMTTSSDSDSFWQGELTHHHAEQMGRSLAPNRWCSSMGLSADSTLVMVPAQDRIIDPTYHLADLRRERTRNVSRASPSLRRKLHLGVSNKSPNRAVMSLCLGDTFLNCHVTAVCAGVTYILIWCSSKDDTCQVDYVVTYDLKSTTVKYHRLQGNCYVILCPDLHFPCLLVAPSTLSTLLIDNSQEDLVNRMMLFESATFADYFCRLNQWDRCSIPVHALEIGLRHRQLDTVAFFLKSRENIFNGQLPSSPHDLAQASSANQLPDTAHVTTEFDQVLPVIQLLVSTVKVSMADGSAKQFADQLLEISLNYLHTLVQNAVAALNRLSVTNDPKFNSITGEVESCLNTLTDYIEELRGDLKSGGRSPSQSHTPSRRSSVQSVMFAGSNALWSVSEGYTDIVDKWKTMRVQDVVTDAILMSNIPLVQAYLHHTGQCASWDTIVSIGLEHVLDCLGDHQMELASQLLANLGFDVKTKLRQICFYTTDKKLREFLISEHSLRDSFTEEENEMMRFLNKLQAIYNSQPTGSRELDSCGWFNALVPYSQVEVPAQTYSDVIDTSLIMLEWIRSWDEVARQRILLEAHQTNSGFSSSVPDECAPGILWRYLVDHNDWSSVKQWLLNSFTSSTSSVSRPPLSVTLLGQLDYCTSSLRERVLDELASHGVFASHELSDFSQLLRRLSRHHSTITSPHPIDLRPDLHSLDLAGFHNHFVSYCVQHHLPDVLYYYLDYFSLGLDEGGLIALQLHDHTCSWLDMLVKFRVVAHKIQDPSVVFQASLSNARFIHDMTQVTIMTLIEGGHVIQALASIMYAPYSLEKILSGDLNSDLYKLDVSHMQQALSSYPKLQAALFANSTPEGATCQDISVYQLLMHTAPFDPSKLFAWQTTNNTITGEHVSLQDMPHFSQPDLVDKFAHRDHLGFLYYLRQGRPSFAFTAFIRQLIKDGASTFSSKKVTIACQKAHIYALKYFKESHIAVACIVFTELLGRDSSLLRVQLEVATVLYAYKNSHILGKGRREAEKVHRTEVVNLLVKCFKKCKCGMQLLPLLEKAVDWQLDRSGVQRTSFEASLRWHLVILFCHLHRLPLTTAFLTHCAREDDWLMFLYFSQVHQYPRQQLLELSSKFKSSSLKEHLYYVLENARSQRNESAGKKQAAMVKQKSFHDKDFRASFLSVVGVQKDQGVTSSSEDDVTTTSESCGEQESEQTPAEEHFVVNKELIPNDIFGVLFTCLSTSKPWRALLSHAVVLHNPVLAVFAACFKESCFVDTLCVWLLMSADRQTCDVLLHSYTSAEYRVWTYDDLTNLCMAYCQRRWTATLATGFKIFNKESPLLPFLHFYSQFEDRVVDGGQSFLELFKNTMYKCQLSKNSETVNQVSWTQKMATMMIRHMLLSEESSYWRLDMLRALDHSNIARVLACQEVLDFNKLCQLQQIAHTCAVSVHFASLLDGAEEARVKECSNVLTLLQEKHMYSEARTCAAICGLPRDDITINEMRWEFDTAMKSGSWKEPEVRTEFWKSCSEVYLRHQIRPDMAAKFFQSMSQVAQSNEEKLLICQLAFDWLSKTPDIGDSDDWLNELQLLIWQCQLQIQLDRMESGSKPHRPAVNEAVINATELTHCGKMPRKKYVHTTTLTEKELRGLDSLLDQLLDQGHICEACKLAVQFDHYSQDLAIILTCIRLASEVETPDTIDEDMKRLLVHDPPRRGRKLSKLLPGLSRTISSASILSMAAPPEQMVLDSSDVIATMERLQQHCCLGQRCCSRIVTLYKVSQLLDLEYCHLIGEPLYTVLRQLLTTTYHVKYSLAQALVESSSLPVDEVAGFVAECIIRSLEVLTGHQLHDVHKGESPSQELVYNPTSADSKHDLSSLIKLCCDASLLGARLVDAAAALSPDSDQSHAVFSTQVELLICAHECYTQACNMEGISNILRAARLCTVNLGQAEEFPLMIRLLTGVGRFSEMTYIFDTLKQNHQFELLFRKGIEKEDRLKLAILEYLKRYPGDTDTYTMVSLHFTMYREIAQLLEEEAFRHLKALAARPLESSCMTTLHNIVQYFSDAAESYVKEECLRHAQNCVKQARLVALQTQLLPMAILVINLTPPQVTSFITHHSKFYEAYIVAEAYHRHSDWASAIYQQMVVSGDIKYLQELRGRVQLTSAVFSEVSDKFLHEKNPTNQMVLNMRKLLDYCKDTVTRYNLAHQLKFHDIVSELMKGDGSAYLQDVINKQTGK